jgi:hypothetical protein
MTRINQAAAIAVAIALAACGRDSAAPAPAGSLTEQDAAAIGGRLSREIGASFAALSSGPRGGIAAAALRTAGPGTPANADVVGCPAVSDATDSDHDGVPDHAVLTFAQPACRSVENGDTILVSGVVELSDPVFSPPPDPAAFGYVASLTGLTVQRIAADSDSSFVETRNGAEALLIGPGGLTQSHAFAIQHRDARGAAAIVDQWHAAFWPAPGGVLVPGAPLPAGTFATQGETSWNDGVAGAQFQLATPVPLAYDPACPADGPNQFRAGEIDATMVDPAHHAFIRITFADCRPPVITLVSAGS